MKYSKGIMWLDDCRIPFVDETDKGNAVPFGDMTNVKIYGRNSYNESKTIFDTKQNQQGRFTPNLLVCDDMLNDGSVSKTSQKNKVVKNTKQMFNYSPQREYPKIEDSGSSSRYYDLDKWFDKVIDEIR